MRIQQDEVIYNQAKFHRFGSCLLFISITNSCRFWGSFTEIQARFPIIPTDFFIFVIYARAAALLPLPAYALTLLQPGDIVCSARCTTTKRGGLFVSLRESYMF